MRATPKKDYLWLVIIGAVLVGAVLLVRRHADAIHRFIETNPVLGLCLYLFLNILDAVVAPGATLPLIPVAARAWGRVPAALATIAGWTSGSLIAFLIAQRWGYPIVRKLTSISRVRQMKRYVPENLFWSVVLLRLVLPMDVISYVLGLFTDMTWLPYVAATALGVAPAAFLLAFLGKLPHAFEIIAIGIAIVVGVAYVLATRRRSR